MVRIHSGVHLREGSPRGLWRLFRKQLFTFLWIGSSNLPPSAYFMIKEESAGGVVFTFFEGILHVLICQPTNFTTWVFPKGRIGDNHTEENKEETAIREVEEETGAQVKILTELSPVSYIYEWKGETRDKTVFMYVMEYLGGDITKHDWEMQKVEWVTVEKAEEMLTHNHSKKILKEAYEWITTNYASSQNLVK